MVWQDPAGLHAEFLDTPDPGEHLDAEDDPEYWAFTEAEERARSPAGQGGGFAIAELRARGGVGDPASSKRPAEWSSGTDRGAREGGGGDEDEQHRRGGARVPVGR